MRISWITVLSSLLTLCLATDSFPNLAVRYKAQDLDSFGQRDFVGLVKRDTCPAGQTACDSGLCCPTGGKCCTGGCGPSPNVTCCPNGKYCPAGFFCCGDGNCVPQGGQCCGDGSACDVGNVCVKISGLSSDVCCTDTLCKAYVSAGVTKSIVIPTINTLLNPQVQLASATTTVGPSATGMIVVTYTITWSYNSYFSTQSTVTFTPITTSSVFFITASNSNAASSSLMAMTSTLPTPAAATSLAPLSPASPSRTGTPNLQSGSKPNFDMSWIIVSLLASISVILPLLL